MHAMYRPVTAVTTGILGICGNVTLGGASNTLMLLHSAHPGKKPLPEDLHSLKR